MLRPCCEPLHHVHEMCSDFRRNRRFLGNHRDSRRAPHMGVLLRLWKCFVCRTICTRAYFMFHMVACEQFENRFANGEIRLWTCRSTPWFENWRLCKSFCKSFLRFFICKSTICTNKLNIFLCKLANIFFFNLRNVLTFAILPTNSQPYTKPTCAC